jgi:hypothetical protein
MDSYPWLRGDTTVDIWNDSVYGWVEHPWPAANWCHLFIKINALCCDIIMCV